MAGFRERNRFLVYLVNFSGLYLSSIERLTRNKWLLTFLAVWTKIAVVLVPIHIGSAVKFLFFDEAPFTLKMAVFRRMIAFSCFLFKNIFFYVYRKDIEALIDLWDSFFREDFFTEQRENKLRTNQKKDKMILSLSCVVTLIASLIYTVPPFFSNTKTLSHPSGIPYRHQSPDYELMIVFDFFRVVMGCSSGVCLDCILMVFLSHVLLQLAHLRDSLTELVEEIFVDVEGRIVFKQQTTSPELVFRFPELGYKESVKVFEDNMRIWVRHHQQVLRFFEGVKNLFAPVASVQLVYVVFYTCFTAFHLVRAKPGIDAFVIPFVAASNLISLYVWCYIGCQVESTNSLIFSDAFGRCWFLYPKNIQKNFSVLLLRSWKPLILRGISLFDLNLFTFFQVIKMTYQLFAFLLQVAREE